MAIFIPTRRSKSVYSGFVPQYQIVLYDTILDMHNKSKLKNEDILAQEFRLDIYHSKLLRWVSSSSYRKLWV